MSSELLDQIHTLELRGLLEDLRAPFEWVATGEEDFDKASLEHAWGRHRAARPAVEACLKRNGISAQLAKNEEDRIRLQAAMASKLGQFRSLADPEERRARVMAMVLPPSSQAVTVEGLPDSAGSDSWQSETPTD